MALEYITRCTPMQYDFYNGKGVSDACETGFVEYFYPKNDLRTGVLEFVVEGNKDHFIIPSKTYLKLELELSGSAEQAQGSTTKPKTVADGTAQACVINNIFHSVFESVEVHVNNVPTTKPDRNHAYSAYLQTLCNYGEDQMKSYFALSGWSKDTAGSMDDYTGTANKGLKTRRKFFREGSGKVELIGKIHSPLFFQEKVLPTQTSLRVILRKAADHFTLMHEKGDFNLSITNAILMVRKVRPVAKLVDGCNKMLEEDHPIPYFLNTPSINHITIDEGSSQFVRDNLFLGGKIPQRIVIGMVETEAYHGKADKNPFNFKHFDLSEITLYKDGTPYPMPMTRMDFETKDCAHAYHNFMCALNGDYARFVPAITMEEYMKGYTLFVYDMSPDQMDCINPGSLTPMNSSIRLELKFRKPTPKNITLLLYSETEHLMEIYRERKVVVDH